MEPGTGSLDHSLTDLVRNAELIERDAELSPPLAHGAFIRAEVGHRAREVDEATRQLVANILMDPCRMLHDVHPRQRLDCVLKWGQGVAPHRLEIVRGTSQRKQILRDQSRAPAPPEVDDLANARGVRA